MDINLKEKAKNEVIKRRLYCIRDSLIGYGAPMVDQNDAAAARTFSYALRNTPELLDKARDLDLFFIGTLDSGSGFLQAESIPKIIIRGTDCIVKEVE